MLLGGCASGGSLANGLSAKTPSQIMAAARAAALGAATVQGQIVLAGHSVRLVDFDNSVYIKGDAAFYARIFGAVGARKLHGRWLKGSAHGSALGALSSLTRLRALLGEVLEAHGPLVHAAGAVVAGQRAVGVSDRALGGTLYVASTGTPYPLEIVEHGPRRGRLVFSNWNQSVSLEPPEKAINLQQLQRR
jgi:hypothetical protein